MATVEDAPGGSVFKLSHECMPPHEGGVKALAVLNDDFIVSGSDDRMVTVWYRLPGTHDFASIHMCPEHQGQVRAVIAIPPCPGVPKGGFATGSLDKTVRVYEFDAVTKTVSIVRSLAGHLGGVISLGLTVTGQLISGGWEGHVRLWDLETGACLQTLEGHENGTCVLGLPTGEIAVGSTGRKNEYDQPVDFKIRIWTPTLSTDGRPGRAAYSIKKVIDDHTLPVRDLALLPGVGFVSVSNDGTAKVRNFDGTVISTFTNPMSTDGHPVFCYSAAVTHEGLIVTCNDDQMLRIYTADAVMDQLQIPGTPWRAVGMPNGDLAVVSDQAGSSRRGHVYIFSKDSSRKCNELEAVRYRKDSEPPAKAKAPSDTDDASAAAAGQFQISGPYDARASVPGTSDGQYGFFKKASGAVMLCTWSSAAGCWTDVGEVQDGPGGADADGDTMMMGGSGSAAAGAGAGGKNWDYVRGVTMDSAGGGMRSMQLCWNEEDDVLTVAKAFVQHNGLSEDSYEEVKNFIIDIKMKEGAAVRARKSAAAAAASGTWTHFPTKSFIDLTTVDFKKVWPKLLELNGTLPDSTLAMSADDQAQVRALVDVLEQTSRYHASQVPRPGVKLLLTKLMKWPLTHVFPCVDVLRILVIHTDGSASLEELGAATFIQPLLDIIKNGKDKPEARPAVLLAARTIFNAFRSEGTRRLIAQKESDVLDAVSDLMQHEHATVKFAAAVVLHNFAHMCTLAASDAKKADKPISSAVSSETVQQAIALIFEGLGSVKEDDAAAKLLISLGALLMLGKEFREFAISMEMESAIKGAAGASAANKGVVDEAVKLLNKK